MKSIKSQLVSYFIFLVVSFIISWLNIMSQPVAFFFVEIVGLLSITLGVASKMGYSLAETVAGILGVAIIAGIGLLPSFLISWIFNVNFFIVYEVVSFITIFLFNGKK